MQPLLAVTFSDGTKKMYFGENVDTSLTAKWGDGDVFSSLSNILMEYVPINPSDVLSEMNADDGSIMFDARILEDCRVNNLCEKLMKYESEKWDRIILSMRRKNVSVTYSDRYLVTPLGCILLAHFIADVQQKLQLNIVSLNIYVKKPNGDAYGNQRIGLEREYGDNVARNRFMEDAIREIAGITPEIVDYGYIEHERCMSIKQQTRNFVFVLTLVLLMDGICLEEATLTVRTMTLDTIGIWMFHCIIKRKITLESCIRFHIISYNK